MAIRAVVFDLGGVVLGSPLHAIAAYERENGIAANFVNRVVAGTAPDGAWSRHERGEIEKSKFVDFAFSRNRLYFPRFFPAVAVRTDCRTFHRKKLIWGDRIFFSFF